MVISMMLPWLVFCLQCLELCVSLYNRLDSLFLHALWSSKYWLWMFLPWSTSSDQMRLRCRWWWWMDFRQYLHKTVSNKSSSGHHVVRQDLKISLRLIQLVSFWWTQVYCIGSVPKRSLMNLMSLDSIMCVLVLVVGGMEQSATFSISTHLGVRGR